MYRVGYPGWKFAAQIGVPVRLRVNIHFDAESGTYWAESPDLDGLVVSGADLDEIKSESLAAAGELLDLALKHRPKAQTDFILHSLVPA